MLVLLVPSVYYGIILAFSKYLQFITQFLAVFHCIFRFSLFFQPLDGANQAQPLDGANQPQPNLTGIQVLRMDLI